MTKEFKALISDHCGITLDNFVIIIGCKFKDAPSEPLSTHSIWIYNLYTEEWKKHLVPNTSCAPKSFDRAVAAA